MAYGQTGSGKTWCMEGSLANPLDWGLVPYALDKILRQASNSSDRSFLVTVSYVELYCEQLYDLLAPPNRGRVTQSALYANSLVVCIDTRYTCLMRQITLECCRRLTEAVPTDTEAEHGW